MKRNTTLLITLLFMLTGAFTLRAQIDPAGEEAFGMYGYKWRTHEYDSPDTTVEYNWIDISTTGTNVIDQMGDDNVIGPIDIGFNFQYYWLEYDELYIGSNGYVMFDQGINVASGADGMPSFPIEGPPGTPSNYIAGYLADLTATDYVDQMIPETAIYYESQIDAGSSLFVVTFENIPFWTRSNEDQGLGYVGRHTFQIILDGNDHSITLQYQNSEGPEDGPPEYSQARWSSIGMENVTGSSGMQIAANQYPEPETAIKIFRPESSDLRYVDIGIDWVLNNRSQAEIVALGDTLSTQLAIRNTGTVRIDGSVGYIEVDRRILDYFQESFADEYQDTIRIADTIPPGEQVIVDFDQPFTGVEFNGIPLEGIFEIRYNANLITLNPQDNDRFRPNNRATTEIIVREVSEEQVSNVILGYDRFIFADDPVLGQYVFEPTQEEIGGGVLELGMSFKPPYYPCTITGLSFHHVILPNTGPDTLIGFTWRVFDDSGPDGAPGQEIATGRVEPDFIRALYLEEDQFFSQAIPATLDEAITLEEGQQIYVSYKLDDTTAVRNNALLQDIDTPISFRTFEITGNTWAPYRDRTNVDFAIQLVADPRPVSRESRQLDFLHISQNYPNPAQDKTTFDYTLDRPLALRMEITDLMGRQVALRDLGQVQPGAHQLEINTSAFPSGAYFCTFHAGKQTTTFKFVVE